jgi:putative SOS response-associated peptidase YedK
MSRELRYTLTALDGLDALAPAAEIAARAQIAPGERAPIVHGARLVEEARWGVLPRWRGHGGKRAPMIYATPLAQLANVPQLRDAFVKARCLVLADGYRDHRPHAVWVHPEPPRVVAFAGVRAINRDDGIASFAVVLDGAGWLVVTDPVAWLDPALPVERARTLVESTADWRTAPAANPSQGELF